MSVESTTTPAGLTATWPLHTDSLSETDGHLRLLKTVLQTTFPNLTGPVTLTQAQINALSGALLTAGGQTVGGTETFSNVAVGGTLAVTGASSHTGAMTGTTATFTGNLTAANIFASGVTGGVSAPVGTFSTVMNAGAVWQAGAALVPAGIITMWYGSTATIPTGWVLCDGTNSTPDLRSKFIYGASSGGALVTGGAASVTLATGNLPAHNHTVTDPGHAHTITDPAHNHTITDPGHAHSVLAGRTLGGTTSIQDTTVGGTTSYSTAAATTGITHAAATTGIGIVSTTTGVTTQNTGSGTSFSILPTYMALAFIMKT